MELNNDKLLKFPAQRNQLQARFGIQLLPEQRKTLATAGLVTLLFVVSFLNNELLTVKKHNVNSAFVPTQSSRLPASVNSNWEKTLIEKYTSRHQTQGIIVAKKPDAFDKLVFGTLNGSYVMTLNRGQIQEIEFNSGNDNKAPEKINNTREFLLANRQLLTVDFNSIQKVSERHENGFIFEEFTMTDSQDAQVASAELKFTKSHQFLSLKINRGNKVASN